MKSTVSSLRERILRERGGTRGRENEKRGESGRERESARRVREMVTDTGTQTQREEEKNA